VQVHVIDPAQPHLGHTLTALYTGLGVATP
jgi:hypothetical protein